MSAETKSKVSRSLAGRSPWNKGLTLEDDCRIISSREAIEKMRESNLGKSLREVTKQRMSVSRRSYLTSHPDAKRVLRETMHSYWETHPEEKKKSAERMSLYHLEHPNFAAVRFSKQRCRDTRPERLVEQLLVEMGLEYEKQMQIGRTVLDFVVCIDGERLAIYVDGCYWHGCSRHFKTLNAYQITRQEGDRRQEASLNALGVKWTRVWECEIAQKREVVRERLMNMCKKEV